MIAVNTGGKLMQILRLCRNVLLAYMVLACLAVSAGAQNIFGSLIGSVTDSGDAVLQIGRAHV